MCALVEILVGDYPGRERCQAVLVTLDVSNGRNQSCLRRTICARGQVELTSEARDGSTHQQVSHVHMYGNTFPQTCVLVYAKLKARADLQAMATLRLTAVLGSLLMVGHLSIINAARQSHQTGIASVMMQPENIELLKKQASIRSVTTRISDGSGSGNINPSDADRLVGYTDEARDDFVSFLPGWGDVRDFNLFAGWVD